MPLALADFGRDRRRSESERASGNFAFFFLSGKQHAISPTSSQTNFTKFAQYVDLCRDESFRNEFLKIFPYGVVFSKKATVLENTSLTSISGPHNSLTI